MIAIPFLLNSLFNFITSLLVAKFLGPAEYGRYALALSIALVLQTFGLDWLRLAATRFYSEHDRRTRPEIRATLDLMLATIAGLAVIVAVAIALCGIKLPLSNSLIALTIGAAVGNGLFDFSAALVRARFLDRAYAALVISKNCLAIALTVGGAWYFGSAQAALIGFILSFVGSLALNQKATHDDLAHVNRASKTLALRYARYGVPIVLSTVLYQTVPALNRGIVAHLHSFGEAGQLSLAFDTGIRIMGAIGAPLDILLFQLAILAEKEQGTQAAERRIAANMGIVFATVLPVICGAWLVLPSFERLLIPPEFRDAFGRYFILALPAMFAFAMLNYGIGPVFQIAHRTLSLVIGGLVAIAAYSLAVAVLPPSADASRFLIAQSIASCSALITMGIVMNVSARIWPSWRDVIGALVATAAMGGLLAPSRTLMPGVTTLLAQVGAGVCIYAMIAWLFDVAGLRSMVSPLAKKWLSAHARRTAA